MVFIAQSREGFTVANDLADALTGRNCDVSHGVVYQADQATPWRSSLPWETAQRALRRAAKKSGATVRFALADAQDRD